MRDGAMEKEVVDNPVGQFIFCKQSGESREKKFHR